MAESGMVNFNDCILNTYAEALERFQRLVICVNNLKTIDFGNTLEALKQCKETIEKLIEDEKESPVFLGALIQLRVQIDRFIEIVQKKCNQQSQCPSPEAEVFKIIKQLPKVMGLPSKRTLDSFQVVPFKKCKQEEAQVPNFLENSVKKPKSSGLEEIIGLTEIKKGLKTLLILPKTQPQLFENRKTCNLVLLYGPPGTGKTQLVHALAAESKATLHCISSSDIISSYVGETERSIKALFEGLKTCDQLSILFIDEVDSFCRKRTGYEQEHTRRTKTELMCQMNNLEELKNVFIICATNCPWDIDSAILRRFQERLYVPLPNAFERIELLKFFLKNEANDWTSDDFTVLMKKTEGYSGSDIANVVEHALNAPIKELEDTKIWKHSDGFYKPVLNIDDFSNVTCSHLSDLPPNSVKARKVSMIDLLHAIENISSTVSEIDLDKYEKFNNK